MLLAMPRSRAGNHTVTARLLAGKAGASMAPTARRRPNSEAKPLARPWATVTADQLISDTP
ncbi:hypothetical protein D3C75_1163120 [compost metagenome]